MGTAICTLTGWEKSDDKQTCVGKTAVELHAMVVETRNSGFRTLVVMGFWTVDGLMAGAILQSDLKLEVPQRSLDGRKHLLTENPNGWNFR